jgi:hypothetical protein
MNNKCLKLFFSILLCICLITPHAYAYASSNNVSKSDRILIDGDLYVTTIKDNLVKVECYASNGVLKNYTLVNKNNNTVIYVDADKNVTKSKITDYVKPANSNITTKSFTENNLATNYSKSYGLIDEPVTDEDLIDSPWMDAGYKKLGSSNVYYCDKPGFLYRKIDSMRLHQEHRFEFTPGTAVSTAIGIVAGCITGGISTAVITGLLGASAGVLVDGFTGTVDCRTYNYKYRVRVAGRISFEPFRNITYWVSTRDGCSPKFEQKSFNNGFSMNNHEMVKIGIDNYLESQL